MSECWSLYDDLIDLDDDNLRQLRKIIDDILKERKNE